MCSVGIIGIVRVIAVWHPEGCKFGVIIVVSVADSLADNAVEEQIWLCVQLSVAVYCCCLPTYRPILPSIAFYERMMDTAIELVSRVRSAGSGSRSSGARSASNVNRVAGSQTETGPATSWNNRYRNISESAVDQEHLTHKSSADIESNSAKAEGFTEGGYPLNAIRVDRSVDLTTSSAEEAHV